MSSDINIYRQWVDAYNTNFPRLFSALWQNNETYRRHLFELSKNADHQQIALQVNDLRGRADERLPYRYATYQHIITNPGWIMVLAGTFAFGVWGITRWIRHQIDLEEALRVGRRLLEEERQSSGIFRQNTSSQFSTYNGHFFGGFIVASYIWFYSMRGLNFDTTRRIVRHWH